MKQFLENNLPIDNIKRKRIAILFTLLIALIVTAIGIYGIGTYGMALFILTPLFIGACPIVIYGQKTTVSKKEALRLGLFTLGLFSLILFVFAFEGIICLLMAAPLALLLTLLGSAMGLKFINNKQNRAPLAVLVLIGAIPSLAFIEKHNSPTLHAVVTTIDISAPVETVWENVVKFPKLPAPEAFLFKMGIAYPTEATIKGTGVGAIRYCNFSTGSFVEPITAWNQPILLQFDVANQPAPMTELSFWDINAPHLHDYFVSKQGQFKLIPLANGKTKLEGTTWYYHNIAPSFYWQIWSDYIVHKIHLRVLEHIKANSETIP